MTESYQVIKGSREQGGKGAIWLVVSIVLGGCGAFNLRALALLFITLFLLRCLWL
jgi:hypothetical protein